MNKTIPAPQTNAVHLTKREIEILTLITTGTKTQDVATQLFVSKRTVDFHLDNIYEKLEVTNRMQAFRRALDLGLLSAQAATEAII